MKTLFRLSLFSLIIYSLFAPEASNVIVRSRRVRKGRKGRSGMDLPYDNITSYRPIQDPQRIETFIPRKRKKYNFKLRLKNKNKKKKLELDLILPLLNLKVPKKSKWHETEEFGIRDPSIVAGVRG